jgi:polysaccharide biosynthesis transport protein
MNTSSAATIQAQGQAQGEPDLGYGQLFGVLLRQKWWVLGAMLLGLTAGGLVGLKEKPLYTSVMQLLVEPNYQGKRGDKTTEVTDPQVEVDTVTQMNLMQSSSLVQQAMEQLKKDYPELEPRSPLAVAGFKKALTVNQLASSDKSKTPTKIFQITYADFDPEKTQRVLSTMEGVYKAYNLQQQEERLKKGLSVVRDQIQRTGEKVTKSERGLEDFRQRQGLIDPTAQASAVSGSLNQLVQTQAAARTQLQELQGRYGALQQRVGLAPQQAMMASRLAQSPRYQSLLNEIQRTELTLAQQQLRFKSGTPELDVVQDQRDRQLNLLRTEVNRLAGEAAPGLGAGQLGELDLGLINQLVAAQVELQSASARYQSLQSEESALRSELQRFPQLLAAYNRLEPEIELNRSSLKQLLQSEQNLTQEIARGGYDWKVVEQPQLAALTASGMVRNILLGSVVGLFVGGGMAFAREAVDDAVHSSEELKKQGTTLPVLGAIPALPVPSTVKLPFLGQAENNADPQDVLQWQPFREAMDLLYQNIQIRHSQLPLKSIVITSALPGEGKSTLALGLAISAARLHKRVLLIDGDLRRSQLHRLLKLPNEHGLATLLSQNLPIPDLSGNTESGERSNISILTAGPAPNDPAKLLSSHRMREMITQFEQRYDLVIVDAPPVLGMVDTILEASCCQGTILVSRMDRVTRSEVTSALAALSQLNVIGMVANGDGAPTRGSYG